MSGKAYRETPSTKQQTNADDQQQGPTSAKAETVAEPKVVPIKQKKPLKTISSLFTRCTSALSIALKVNVIHKPWWVLMFQPKGNVIPKIFMRMLFIMLVSLGLCITFYFVGLEEWRKVVTFEKDAHSFVGVALGLLLVYRTNSSYDRYWEGRKAWGAYVGYCRNIMVGHECLSVNWNSSSNTIYYNSAF